MGLKEKEVKSQVSNSQRRLEDSIESSSKKGTRRFISNTLYVVASKGSGSNCYIATGSYAYCRGARGPRVYCLSG